MPLKTCGKVYKIKGKEVTLYPIAKIAEELEKAGFPRETQTIRKWEVSGIIPPAKFRKGHKRLYSREQIDVIVETAKECNIRQGYSLSMTDFSERVWERMKEVNEKILQN